MKGSLTLIFLSLLLGLTSCDSPSNSRARGFSSGKSNSQSSGFTDSTQSGGSTTGNTTSGGTSGTGTGGTTTGSSSGFENCNLGFNYFSANIGQLGICQSTLDEKLIKVKFALTDQSSGTCFIPTYKGQDGSSLYVGPAQCTYHVANQVMDGTLVKNRSGYESYPINGVMAMKSGSLNDYFACMDAIPNFIRQNCPTNTTVQCQQAAQNYMYTVCNAFKQNHAYIDIRLK